MIKRRELQNVLKNMEGEILTELKDKKNNEFYDFLNENLTKKNINKNGELVFSNAQYKTLIKRFE